MHVYRSNELCNCNNCVLKKKSQFAIIKVVLRYSMLIHLSRYSACIHCILIYTLSYPFLPRSLPLPSTELVQSCRDIGEETLRFLAVLKQERPGSGTIATGANSLQKSIRTLGRLAEVCLTHSPLWPVSFPNPIPGMGMEL